MISKDQENSLFRVLKNDAGGVALIAAQTADTMAQVDAVVASAALDRSVVDGENHGVWTALWW